MVPICVVAIETAELPPRTVDFSRLAARSLGVGSPIYVDAQGGRRLGTVACLVSDGSDFYVLTNTHLAGQSGRSVYTMLRGVPQRVGTTVGTRNLTEKTFSQVYPELPGRNSVINIDAAIVRMDKAAMWDPQGINGFSARSLISVRIQPLYPGLGGK
jgi:hypothetical protein